MSLPSRLPAVEAPPHDPSSLLLAGWIGSAPRRGFRVARTDRLDVPGVVRLAPAPDSARALSEPSGSFGGHRPPANVAVGSLGEIYLLDPGAGVLKQFDPCECRFERVGCFVLSVADPADPCFDRAQLPSSLLAPVFTPLNVLSDPQAIAFCNGDLFIADRGHGRVVRFTTAGWLPRGVLMLPRSEADTLGGPWRPTGLAFDGKGVLHVSDPDRGRIDRFNRRGEWLGVTKGLPRVTYLAVDCSDVVYAVVDVEILRDALAVADGTVIALDSSVAELRWRELLCRLDPPSTRCALDVAATDASVTLLTSTDWRRLSPSRVLHERSLSLVGQNGRWLALRVELPPAAPPVTKVTFIARGAYVVRIVNGQAERVLPDRADLFARFPLSPVIVDAAGRIRLECAEGQVAFDGRGDRLRPEALAIARRFVRTGELVTQALDSRIEGCTWDRVELRGRIPPGCSIAVQVTTAEIELTSEEVTDLPPNAWSNASIAGAMDGAWDCLLNAPSGRYLWLRLQLNGGGDDSPCLSAIVVQFPRVSLRRYLPAVFGADPRGADFTDRFTALFDASLRSIERKLDRLPSWFDPLSAPVGKPDGSGDFLTWLASWIGVTLTRDWPEERRRHYVKQAARLYCLRGTRKGLWKQLLLLLGFDRAYASCLDDRTRTRCVPLPLNCNSPPPCTSAEPPPLLLEHYQLRQWLYAGQGRLGTDSVLWGKRIVNRSELSGQSPPPLQTGNAQVGATQLKSVPDPLRDPFHVFAHKFSVFVPARVRDCAPERRAFERLLAAEIPAHTQCDIRYVEPRFRVGVQAMIGLDSVIARSPRDVVLERSRLGEGTVLSAPPQKRRDGKLEVGTARIGADAVLS